ncbi:hypothetical protein MKK84_19015 [Methylobacterium sp. E-065]|uniref:hypothetical protein n=1 Tax=Methylobacterium sp. E-065 TaxID=2836583 RepID=UPI001FBC07DD|nr:hypothetical protein [Methylobacterium sp. E-065]MCJ2019499.1 hypothetical protein [Methylobacterium sp. E-065]
MRFFLMSVLLFTSISAPRADDLADLPNLACTLALTSLERQHIGCPSDTTVIVAQPIDEQVRFAQPDDNAPND